MTQDTVARKTLVSIARIAELAKFCAQNQTNQKIFTGVMFSLSILYEEFTGHRLESNPVSPKEVFAWAQRIMDTGEFPIVN